MRLESGDDETPKGREGLAAERGRRRLGFVCKDQDERLAQRRREQTGRSWFCPSLAAGGGSSNSQTGQVGS
jgi:hypothetical protein